MAIRALIMGERRPRFLFMAAITFHVGMGTGEREVRFPVVIEAKLRFRLRPGTRRMALGAILERPPLGLMDIPVA